MDAALSCLAEENVHAGAAAQDVEEVRAVIPRRTSLLVDRGVLIVAFATHKQKSLFFFLVQVHPTPWSSEAQQG